MASLSLRHIYKKYPGNVVAVKDVNLEIKDKEFIVLVGPSGCGKSTTLRMIAGLEEISEGELYIGDRLVNDIAPKDRDIAMVFQNYALYPHMTVFDNMAFGLKLRKVPKDEIARKVEEAAKILDLSHLLDRKPKAMSGGQRQRVALGRAIVRNPQVFLLDEPLSNLDAKLRAQMRTEISKLHKKLGTTFIYVTHDQTEAMTLGTRIVVMKDGVIQQVDTPQHLYDMPCNMFVAGFIGESNIFDAVVISQDGDTVTVGTEVGKAQASGFTGELAAGTAVSVSVRPENMLYSRERVEGFHIKGVVKEHIYVGNLIKTIVLLNDGTEVKINRFSMDDLPKEGEMIYLYWHLEKGIVLPEKNLVDTDASRDIEGGDEDEEE